ncbi:hypothetical protein BDCR2A_01051 [Borrelia duttonii CR2A]|uniref:Uncharacterized protein n=1 Tax=Borrelia duttonii CR2A TaxID=1432657 RepID=W6TXI3_9SPIR|nr:hypothetical protein BDCR2A_01051 [Borrelia duttonii CR2A]
MMTGYFLCEYRILEGVKSVYDWKTILNFLNQYRLIVFIIVFYFYF